MAGITLREYVREIEKQLDGKRTDEAIAHSHYLLQSYSKHLDIYRLLGKAFLDNQRFGDAADIFQRVLSAIPDDFVSHAGMSIIREDEGNLDEAIWHMERAFDVQPSNSAIQEELRRMYGRRDNVEPPKIRLTRGALARMYYRGELYPQAVAETRAALAESPDRLDLQALLAEIHYKAGQKAEAADISNQILRRLPYCQVANRILYEMLSSTDREDEARPYLQRLSQLDPYYAYVTPQAPSVESVPDSAVRVDKLDWKVGQTQAGRGSQPSWAASLGVDLGEAAQGGGEALPDWLSSFSETKSGESGEGENANVPAFAENINEEITLPEEFDLSEASPVGEDQIPDWMKDLGWTPASGASQEAETGYHFEEELGAQAVEGELAAADLPDWLETIAPQDEATAARSEENVDPWMDKLFSGQETDREQDQPQSETPPASSELPEWLIGEAALTGEPAGADDTPTAPPDWLAELGGTSEESGETPPPAQAELPDWLRAELSPPASKTDLPDWLQAEETATEASGEPPAWLYDEEAGVAGAPPEAAEFPGDELPDWLAEGTPAESAETTPAAEGEPPDWLSGSTETEPSEAAEGELPDWLAGLTPTETAETPTAGEGELPDWLAESMASEADETVELPAAEAALPDWLAGVVPTESAEMPPKAEAEEPAAEAGLPDWLSEEAESQEPLPAAEGELPGWLSESVEPDEVAELPASEAELPEWLVGAIPSESAETGQDEEAELPAAEGELPDWLAEGAAVESAETTSTVEGELPGLLSEAKPAEISETTPEAEGELPAVEGELPDWLSEAAEEVEPGEAVELPAAEAAMPGWMDESAEVESEETAQPAAELPAWLFADEESTAADRLDDESAAPAAAQEDEIPAWLLDAEPPAQVIEGYEPETAEPLEAEELPDWLMEAQGASAIIIDEAATAAPETVPPVVEPLEVPPVEPEPAELDDAYAWLAAMLTPQEPPKEPPQEPAQELAEIIPQTPPVEEITPEAPAAEMPAEPGAGVFPIDEDATFAWLESLAVKQGASEALLLTPEERQENAPEWVQQATAEAEAQAAQELEALEAQEEAAETPPESEDEGPAGGAGVFPVEALQAAPEEPEAPSPTFDEDDAFAWLESLAVKQGANEALLLTPEERQEDAPEWVQQAAAEAEAHTLTDGATETPATEDLQPAEPTSPGSEEDDAFAWLESLAVKQGANEALLLTPEERQEDAPEWVQQAAAEAQAEPQVPAAEDRETETMEADAWPPHEAVEVPAAEMPAVEEPVEAEPSESSAFEAEPAAPEASMDWMEPETPVEPAEEIPDLPDWLAGGEFDSRDEPLEWKMPVVTRRRYDLNLATLAELERLPGIGFIMAQRIVDYREVHGPFKQVDELLNIEEFTEFTLEGIRENLFIYPVGQPPAPAAGLRLPGVETDLPMEEVLPEPGEIAPEAVGRARELADAGQWEAALGDYTRMIQSGEHLSLVIDDLNAAAQQHPEDSDLWQSLGDAYVRANRLKDAMQAYAKAEKLLR